MSASAQPIKPMNNDGVKINVRSVERFLTDHPTLKPEVAEKIRHRLDCVANPTTKMFPEEELLYVMGDPGIAQAFRDGWSEKSDSVPPWALAVGGIVVGGVTAQHGFVD